MDCANLADEFIELQFLNSKIFLLDIYKKISGQGEERVLLYLWKKHDGVLSGDLARELCLTTGRTANILKALERKKYIFRKCRLEDKRKVSVFLTEKGKQYIEKVYQNICSDHQKIFEYLGVEDSANLVRICKKIMEFQNSLEKEEEVVVKKRRLSFRKERVNI